MKIVLRERTESHVCTYFERTQDAEIRSMLPQAAMTVEQAVEDYRKTLLPGATSYGRTVYADDVYVGDVWCYCIDHNEEPNAMLSYCIFEKSLWGKGAATEAVKQFLDEVVPKFRLETIGAFTYSSNASSIRVLEKNGFSEMEEFAEDGVLSKYLQKTTGSLI